MGTIGFVRAWSNLLEVKWPEITLLRHYARVEYIHIHIFSGLFCEALCYFVLKSALEIKKERKKRKNPPVLLSNGFYMRQYLYINCCCLNITVC